MRNDFSLLACIVLIGMISSQAMAQSAEQAQCVSFESEVFAQRGNAVVTHADVDAFLEARVPQEQRKTFLESPGRVAEMIETLLSTYGMAERAIEAELTSEAVVSAGLYITIARELASMYRDEYLASNRLEDYESAARELYLSDPTRFNEERSYNLHHILIEEDGSRNSPDKMKQALAAYDRLEAGSSFTDVAGDLESGSGSSQDVELNEVRPSDLVAPLRGVVGDAEAGQLLAPIRSQYGWHIVRVASVNTGQQRSWEEARPMAISMAQQRHDSQLLERLRKDVQSQEAELSEGAVATLLERFDVEWSGATNHNQVLEQSASN